MKEEEAMKVREGGAAGGGPAEEGRGVEAEWGRRKRHEDVSSTRLGRDICSRDPSA